MPTEPYLLRLGTRLSAGLVGMQPDRRARHRRFVLSQQMADGGFRGREGDSDLYYTSFAVRGLSLLGGMDEASCTRVAEYLRQQQPERLGAVDLLNWLAAALAVQLAGGPELLGPDFEGRAEQILGTLEAVRTADGGYAKSSEGAAGSMYHSFLVGLSYELLGRRVPRPNALVQFIYDRQRDDGGFVEIAPMRRSGTNPTAAAVALLGMLGALDDEIRADVGGFLREVLSDEGGFRANTRIPFADGLSTFTGLLTAQDLGLHDVIDPARALEYITEWLEFPSGGCRGASWDEQADVEYTFYGLGVLALLA